MATDLCFVDVVNVFIFATHDFRLDPSSNTVILNQFQEIKKSFERKLSLIVSKSNVPY